MLPICLVNAETMEQLPEDVRAYLRALRRRIVELERTEPQKRIAELEGGNRRLQVELDDAQELIARQQERIEELRQQLNDANAKLNTDSSNSSRPPSSDRFHSKRKPPRSSDQPRKGSGGQRGHPGHRRPLVPPEQVQRTIPCLPEACRRCGKPLTGSDPDPLRHQVVELPPIVLEVVEYQLHRLTCPCCRTSTCGNLPDGIQGHFGPRLEATLALLAGRYRLGLRSVVGLAAEWLGLDISTGMVGKLRQSTAEALELPWVQLAMYVREHNVNVDETGWREGKRAAYLWAAVTPLAALFRIAKGRTAQAAAEMLGRRYCGVASCDRLKSYWWIKRLQWCWAHLRRDFQAMIDRDTPGKVIGEELLRQSDTLFHLWHQLADDKLSREQFQQAIKPVRQAVEQALQRGKTSSCGKTAGTCKELLSHEEWLWTFVDVEGVQPTNNEAERTVRHAVLWRKVSGGTDSPQGSRFVERVLSVVESCRRQGKKALDYLTACIDCYRHDRTPPSLLPDTS